MTTCPKDCWGVRLNEEDIGEINVTGSPWLTGTAGSSQSDPKRVLCDRLVRGEMNQAYITALASVAANDALTHGSYVSGYLRPWLLFNAPDILLGDLAALHGANVRSYMLPLAQIGRVIRAALSVDGAQ